MINLLANVKKDQIRAARTNIILVRYLGIAAIAVAFMLTALYVSHTVLESTMKSAQVLVDNNSAGVKKMDGLQQKLSSLSGSLAESRVALDQTTDYAAILRQLGPALPKGVIVSTLELSENPSQESLLVVLAKTESLVQKTQDNLIQFGIFSGASLKDKKDSGDANYPIEATLIIVNGSQQMRPGQPSGVR